MLRMISGLTSAVVVLALALPAAADEKKDRRDKAWKVYAGMQYGFDSKPKDKKNEDSRWWKPNGGKFGRGRNKWKHHVHYHSCASPAHKFCNNHKNPNRYKNNGFGNGDHDAPGKSEFKNNAENAGGHDT